MARPFRFQPPAASDLMIERPRLQSRLGERWRTRLVTVVAGPGFGKSVLLAGAVAGAERPDGAVDVWLSCEPADENEPHLRAGIAETLAAPLDASLEDLVDHVWAKAPVPVCFVFDDVHEIAAASAGARFLSALLTELPRNGHMVLSSRDPAPVATARLAAVHELERIHERDLLFDDEELGAFARARNVEVELLRTTGGWPALAELTASAGQDLVLDYLREEVLAAVGPERALLLARFALVGGGDDSVATALAGTRHSVDDLIRDVPLVERGDSGWAALHPLWLPALVRLLDETAAYGSYRAAAAAHEAAGRVELAVELLAEAEAWDEVLRLLRGFVLRPAAQVPVHELMRFHELLPRRLRREPAALLLSGLTMEARDPHDALETLQAAGTAFRRRGDLDGELAAIAREGIVRWWSQDLTGLLSLQQRVAELAAEGSEPAAALGALGHAAVAHVAGDANAVLKHLAGIDDRLFVDWLYVVHWLRSVAYRQVGDLGAARAEIALAAERTHGGPRDRILHMASQHLAWLEGRVDDAFAQLKDFVAQPAQLDAHRYLAREVSLDLAAKAAWLGDVETSSEILASQTPLDDMPSPRLVRAIATAGVAVNNGDEPKAAAVIRDVAGAGLEGTPRWFWRDRLAIALTHVLLPETRATWARDPMGPPHRPGLVLAEALEAARDGALRAVSDLRWPEPGVVRAHLPVAWIAELVAAGAAARNPAPPELLQAIGPALREGLVVTTANTTTPSIVASAAKLMATVPSTPRYELRIEVLGPISVRHDGVPSDHPELRRRRVRELLCYLVAHRRARREVIIEDLWPDATDGGRNLRVTLTYLQRVLQPERRASEPPFFVRAEGEWLVLVGGQHLAVDAWELDGLLDRAGTAEHARDPADALGAYRAALPLWRGEPYADVPYAAWAGLERLRLTQRYVPAAIRAAELLVAAGDLPEARRAAEQAIAIDPAAERAARLLATMHHDAGDPHAARQVLDRCVDALADLGVPPDASTRELLDTTE